MNKKVTFTGGFGEYFIMSLGLLLLSVITFGLALPYLVYWSFKYFFASILLFITIIGIPFAKQHFKLAALALTPFGREIRNKEY